MLRSLFVIVVLVIPGHAFTAEPTVEDLRQRQQQLQQERQALLEQIKILQENSRSLRRQADNRRQQIKRLEPPR